MLPCEYLWAWLAAQLSPPSKQNLYASWITDNNDPKGAYAMGNFLTKYKSTYPNSIDNKKAIEIYKQAMSYEKQNFEAATT